MSSFTTDLKYKETKLKKGGRMVYEITEPFSYAVGDLTNPLVSINIPTGYLTDFASIPWPLTYLFKPDGDWAKAAVVHDYIYSNMQNISLVIADSIFLEAMLVLKINVVVAYIFYWAVRIYQQLGDNRGRANYTRNF